MLSMAATRAGVILSIMRQSPESHHLTWSVQCEKTDSSGLPVNHYLTISTDISLQRFCANIRKYGHRSFRGGKRI